MQQKITWILVADAGNARIIERIGTLGGLIEIQNLSHSHESTHEHGPDRPGRGFESSGTTRHAYEPRSDWHEQQKDEFAKEIVTLLNEAHLNKKFDELYVLAPAKMLGLLRHHITNTNHHIGPKVAKELTKDATSCTLDELEQYID
ncbi:MAG: host attachment protein [Alphaproteobacteria bacterium]|nr:host attachment protein [Alphaproteobacteria bacterium]